MKKSNYALPRYRQNQTIVTIKDIACTITVTAISATILGAVYLFSTMPPCATEDSTFCHWNAQTQGNGHGNSIINL